MCSIPVGGIHLRLCQIGLFGSRCGLLAYGFFDFLRLFLLNDFLLRRLWADERKRNLNIGEFGLDLLFYRVDLIGRVFRRNLGHVRSAFPHRGVRPFPV